MLKNVDFGANILQTYHSSWHIWIAFFVIGFLLVKYAEQISTTKREINKKISTGSGLMALSIVVHLAVIYALLTKV